MLRTIIGVLAVSTALWSQTQTTAVRAGRLFDPKSGQMVANQVVLIQGERITQVGPAASVSIPTGARVIDLSRATVLPSLIRRGASRLLLRFARTHGKPMSLEDTLWDDFSQEHGFSAEERKCPCLYSLVRGDETGHQLALLAVL